MTQPSRILGLRATRLQRSVVALLCAQLLLSACHATSVAPLGATWPEPMPQPPEAKHATSPQWPTNATVRTVPDFQAPSATHCARPVQTREVPGRDPNPVASRIERDDARTYDTAEEERVFPRSRGKRADHALAESSARTTEPPPPSAPSPSAVIASSEPTAKFAPSPSPRQRPAPPQQQQSVTAGMVDDNADFAEYLRFRDRTQVAHRPRDVRERYLLQVRNARGTVVPDAEVAVTAPSGATLWARTDAGGRAWLHPDAVDTTRSAIYEVAVRKDGRQSSAFLRRGQKSAVDVVLADSAAPAQARLDLVFLIDATGSMADEIGRLKTTLRTIANDVAQLPSRPDTCFGLVAYRDKGDEFLLRSHDFTNDLNAFQGVLDALHANGGGDYPEAMNEALKTRAEAVWNERRVSGK